MGSKADEFGPDGKWGKIIRGRDGEEIYISYRDRKKHFMRMFDGWGVQEEVVKSLIKRGVTKLILSIKDEGEIYTRPHFLYAFGNRAIFDSGWQYFLPERRWHKVRQSYEQSTLY